MFAFSLVAGNLPGHVDRSTNHRKDNDIQGEHEASLHSSHYRLIRVRGLKGSGLVCQINAGFSRRLRPSCLVSCTAVSSWMRLRWTSRRTLARVALI